MNIAAHIDQGIIDYLEYDDLMRLCATSTKYAHACNQPDSFWVERAKRLYGIDLADLAKEIKLALNVEENMDQYEDIVEDDSERSIPSIMQSLRRLLSMSKDMLFRWAEQAFLEARKYLDGNGVIILHGGVPINIHPETRDIIQLSYIFSIIFRLDLGAMVSLLRDFVLDTQKEDGVAEYGATDVRLVRGVLYRFNYWMDIIADANRSLPEMVYDIVDSPLLFLYDDYYNRYGAKIFYHDADKYEIKDMDIYDVISSKFIGYAGKARKRHKDRRMAVDYIYSGIKDTIRKAVEKKRFNFIYVLLTHFKVISWRGDVDRPFVSELILSLATSNIGLLYKILDQPDPSRFITDSHGGLLNNASPLGDARSMTFILTTLHSKPQFAPFVRMYLSAYGAKAVLASVGTSDDIFRDVIALANRRTMIDVNKIAAKGANLGAKLRGQRRYAPHI